MDLKAIFVNEESQLLIEGLTGEPFRGREWLDSPTYFVYALGSIQKDVFMTKEMFDKRFKITAHTEYYLLIEALRD